MNQRRWVLLLKKDDTVDIYHTTESGKYQKVAPLTHQFIISPEKIAEIVDEPAANAWMHAVKTVLHTALVKHHAGDRVHYGIIDEQGDFFEPDMVTMVYMIKLMIEHVFLVLVETQANAA